MDVTKQTRVHATIPPRTIDVHKFAESRASELEALHSVIANRLNNDFRSNRSKRRRTTGYDDRVAKKKYRKRQKLGVTGSKDGVVSNEGWRKVPRRVRRRNELKKNPESGFVTSGDGTKRLRTHVWHAKRFTMTKMWGFHLPLGLHGRGMGSRALLKKFRDGVLIHDASYYGAVQLEGPQDSLINMLATIFVLCKSSQLEDMSVLSGSTYGTAMLHHAGALFSPALAPIIYMWQPLDKPNPATPTNCPDAESSTQHSSSTSRKLWVWIHGSAFNEGYDALKLSCRKQMNEAGVSISCISLQGKLAKLELMGSKTVEVVHKILYPIRSDAENPWQIKKCSDKESGVVALDKKFRIPENISSSAIVSLRVCDPRILSEKKFELGPEKTPTSKENHLKEDDGKNMELRTYSSSEVEDLVSENLELWESNKRILPPVEENILCMEKQQKQLALFRLENVKLEKQRTTAAELFCRACPIMLLNGRENKDSITRCSIVLPLSWVKPFWGCLISRGAHAIGLREKHWVASNGKLPCFPSDFPDCSSYSCYMATKAAASEETLKLRPLATRPSSVPVPPPWKSIQNSINALATRSKDVQSTEPCEINDRGALGHCVSSSEFFVARTSKILAEFLDEIRGQHLLLFPCSLDSENNVAKFMKNDDTLRERAFGDAPLINYGRRLCFLRVVLEACRGGVFEEGSVVCSRINDDKEDVQLPQSAVRSYFQQQPSGTWELQIPEHSAVKSSHRWPIGFITSGFVRGSKKPSAIALCEATLLALLREEQWKDTLAKRRRKEIYVLVRNLRSTTYRLALATIVLEQQEDDLTFG